MELFRRLRARGNSPTWPGRGLWRTAPTTPGENSDHEKRSTEKRAWIGTFPQRLFRFPTFKKEKPHPSKNQGKRSQESSKVFFLTEFLGFISYVTMAPKPLKILNGGRHRVRTCDLFRVREAFFR